MKTAARRFPIRFDPLYRVLSTALLISPADSYLELDAGTVHVRMSWAFRARFPRSAVASVALSDRRPLSRGVHGFAGRWLVNGSGQGILVIRLAPEARAFVMGIPVRLRELWVSVDEPGVVRAALSTK